MIQRGRERRAYHLVTTLLLFGAYGCRLEHVVDEGDLPIVDDGRLDVLLDVVRCLEPGDELLDAGQSRCRYGVSEGHDPLIRLLGN